LNKTKSESGDTASFLSNIALATLLLNMHPLKWALPAIATRGSHLTVMAGTNHSRRFQTRFPP
jgi:hypothetical protein